MEQRLLGKVAIVTGAGQGIGQGVATRLAREGASVVIADYNAETANATAQEIAQSTGSATLAYSIDISDVTAGQIMVDAVVAKFGHIDILINNAGLSQTKPMLELTPADWDRILNVNQRGMFFVLQSVATQMIRQIPENERPTSTMADVVTIKKSETKTSDIPVRNHGKIVNLSSIAGRRGRPLATHYAASKAAVISITQSAALTLAPYNITVNAVCPGVVPTQMWKDIDADRGRLFGSQPGEAMAAFVNTIPLKRASTPEDIAGPIAFFCSADADYVTGQALNVDGGYEMD
ncbi:MAG: glucose 1-dehydrogenase [Chloroflexi bacterium]|nr:glucose 1-dehydrogenase [Chloroflexota bacterium]